MRAQAGIVLAPMRVGVVKEIKTDEYRIALTPAGARELHQRGHEVLVETGAGTGSSFSDADYEAVGARIRSVDEVWQTVDLLLKVKEPVPSPSTSVSARGSSSSPTSTSPRTSRSPARSSRAASRRSRTRRSRRTTASYRSSRR